MSEDQGIEDLVYNSAMILHCILSRVETNAAQAVVNSIEVLMQDMLGEQWGTVKETWEQISVYLWDKLGGGSGGI